MNSKCTGITNYLSISDILGTAGQPTPDQFATIRAAGYEVVVNLAMPDSTDALPNEGVLVTAEEMDYVHIPVVWESPTAEDLECFFAVMDQNQGRKIFVHCAMNMRVSCFVFLYRVLRLGLPREAAWQDVLAIWEPNEIWQQFIDERLKQVAWQSIRKAPGPDLKLFQVQFNWIKNPRNAHTIKATILESPDWVNVIAMTSEEKLVVVHQYRFGTQEITTEIPAGIVEAGEASREAAIRELKEETGYTSKAWVYLGYVEPNPAFLNNQCHHWLARNARQTSPPELDDGENLYVSEMSIEDIRQEIIAGRFRHSLDITALAHLFDLRELLKTEGGQLE